MKNYLSFLLLFAFFYYQVGVSQEKNPEIVKSIEKNAKKFLKNKNINSVSIGVYKDGISYTQHLGELNKGEGNLPNNQTIYEVGSVSKTLTGYLIAKAVLEGKLRLDDDIRLYLKGDYSNLEYNGTPITIKHLLTHTGCLPMFIPTSMNGVYEKLNKTVPAEFLALEKASSKAKFLSELKIIELKQEPGTAYLYSNAGAELTGLILEKVYENTIDQLLKETFGTPYNMPNTAIQLDSSKIKNLARGYWMDSETKSPNNYNSLWATGSGMKMTLLDLLNFAKLQLDIENPIVAESHKVLYEKGKTFKIGYFWRVWTDKYGTSYNHHGGTSGTQNWLFIFPKYDLGIAIITNQSGPKTPQLLSKTARGILKDIIEN